MKATPYPHLFKPIQFKRLRLKNRITMAPLYLGYALEGGKVSPLMLEHYRMMAKSGAALIVVENAAVSPEGMGSSRTLRCDHGRYVPELEKLAQIIKRQKAKAGLQINHAGRFAFAASTPLAPAAEAALKPSTRVMTKKDIRAVRNRFTKAAQRVQQAGFDLVELHGGTGYLLSQFVSPRTNRRTDEYGGAIENRIRFPLEVLRSVKDAVGDFPVGYRFLADEWLPDGLGLDESGVLAEALAAEGVAYISVMGGTYESFFLPEVISKSKKPGYMVSLAAAVKKRVPVPVITAGRISTPARAEKILGSGKADMIGLARVLWTDPQWPIKARTGNEAAIIKCSPKCNACMELVMQGKPAFCPRWIKEKRQLLKSMFR
jgi:NADPH2 dehydrogenase